MKVHFTNQRCQALTFLELLVIILCLVVLVVMLLPVLAAAKRRSSKINCVSNIKQVNLSLRIWEGDHNNEYPMQVSVTNGGGKEWIAAGDVAGCMRVASNEMCTTRILICPEDTDHTFATNFENDFNNSHISYFLSPDASETYPQMILDGDDNFEMNGVAVKSGLFAVSSIASIVWGPGRHGDVPVHHFWTPTPHNFFGNLGFADGSVAAESSLGLQNALQFATNGTPFATNRFAIP